MIMSDAIGLEKVMTFEEWIRQECFKAPPEYAVELAKSAWDYLQANINALEDELHGAKQACLKMRELLAGDKRIRDAAMAVVNAYKPVSRNASAGPTALMAELAALLQEPTK